MASETSYFFAENILHFPTFIPLYVQRAPNFLLLFLEELLERLFTFKPSCSVYGHLICIEKS